MASERQRHRAVERIQRLAHSTMDSDSLRHEVIAELKRTIGFERWCWPVADPETLLPGQALWEHDYGAGLSRHLHLEYAGDLYAGKQAVATARNPTASLHAATGGDLSRSRRWDEVLAPHGVGDMATVACRDELGTWGWMEAYRDRGDPPFEPGDLDVLRQVSRALGSALRIRSMKRTQTAGEPRPPGVIVLDANLRVSSWTAAARAWIHVMPGGDAYDAMGLLPGAMYALTGLARARTETPARLLWQGPTGEWISLEAALLEGAQEGSLVVTARAATAEETFGLLCRAFGLSPRERELVGLIVGGRDTKAITQQLGISRHTVQEHVTSVFDKTGVRSRQQLMALLAHSPPAQS